MTANATPNVIDSVASNQTDPHEGRVWHVTSGTLAAAAAAAAASAAGPTRPGRVEQDSLPIGWGEARKHRQRIRTLAGRTVVIDLPRGTFLDHDQVLWRDASLELRVVRPLEPAILVEFADNPGVEALRSALLLGYTWGNQHAPLDLDGHQVRVPLLVGHATAEKALADLGLVGRVTRVRIAAHGWSTTSADHREAHQQDQTPRTAHSHPHVHLGDPGPDGTGGGA